MQVGGLLGDNQLIHNSVRGHQPAEAERGGNYFGKRPQEDSIIREEFF